MSQDIGPSSREVPKRQVFRDVVVLQAKLVLDGLRDVILVPVSLIAALIDLFDSGHEPGYHFYRVARFGRETERFIDLFEAADRIEHDGEDRFGFEGRKLDGLITEVEGQIKGQISGDDGTEAGLRRRLRDLLKELKRIRGGEHRD